MANAVAPDVSTTARVSERNIREVFIGMIIKNKVPPSVSNFLFLPNFRLYNVSGFFRKCLESLSSQIPLNSHLKSLYSLHRIPNQFSMSKKSVKLPKAQKIGRQVTDFLVPTIIDKIGGQERAYDIYSRLLEDRIIFLGDAIDSAVANTVIAQLLYLEKSDPKAPITLYVNSPGGHVTAGLAIYDTMQHVKPDVITVCIGLAASMGSIILA